MKSKKIRDSARNEECQVRIPGICNFNDETTVAAHIGSGAGMGRKVSDLEIAYCCSSCHDVLDGRVRDKHHSYDDLLIMGYQGAARTREILASKQLINVK